MSPDLLPAAPAGITPRQAIVIDLLATGSTITKAAEQGGIARKTLYNWLETEAFQAALTARRRELAERVAESVQELGAACVGTLMDILRAMRKTTTENLARSNWPNDSSRRWGCWPDRLGRPAPAENAPSAARPPDLRRSDRWMADPVGWPERRPISR